MDLAEAEQAALDCRPKAPRAGVGLANVGQPRDSVTEWEERVATQFQALEDFAKRRGRALRSSDMPPLFRGATPGREITAYLHPFGSRVWKSTFPGQSGFGPFGFYTPAGYLRRLRLSNRIFGDDVQFEGIWRRPEGLSIVTSQPYIQPHPVRFIPTDAEISSYLSVLGFSFDESSSLWERGDGVQLGDVHNRNFIRAPDENILAIDVQPRLRQGHEFECVIAAAR
ncbi:MAG: hypothetical protein JNJ70_06405 [Verrucomicrobiales bacterium]|nr:hypothetical protein [Verrucomicrobiales bacterium]